MSGSGRTPSGARGKRVDAAARLAASAWERFAAGDDVAEGVRPEVLLSWRRCRDDYSVDPTRDRAPLAAAAPSLPPEESVVAAELGAAAMSITDDVRALGGVVAVADGSGRILASWGHERTAVRGGEQNLGPLYWWSEPATGTTGVGTALQSRDAVAIDRYEHWCSAFHDWSCAAVAVRDPVTDVPVGVIDISIWNRPLPAAAVGWLKSAVQGVELRLRERAALAYGELVTEFRRREAAERGLAVLDAGGRVVLADESAKAALGMADTHLQELARSVVARARHESGWIGSAVLATGATVAVEPVTSGERVIGILVRAGRDDGEPLVAAAPADARSDRLVGLRGSRMVLVPPESVRFVEIEDGFVWLCTEEGRMRSPVRGLEQLEERLQRDGFMRINRSTLVNLSCVREVVPSFKGAVWAIVDGSERLFPVSRRRVQDFRAALGI